MWWNTESITFEIAWENIILIIRYEMIGAFSFEINSNLKIKQQAYLCWMKSFSAIVYISFKFVQHASTQHAVHGLIWSVRQVRLPGFHNQITLPKTHGAPLNLIKSWFTDIFYNASTNYTTWEKRTAMVWLFIIYLQSNVSVNTNKGMIDRVRSSIEYRDQIPALTKKFPASLPSIIIWIMFATPRIFCIILT